MTCYKVKQLNETMKSISQIRPKFQHGASWMWWRCGNQYTLMFWCWHTWSTLFFCPHYLFKSLSVVLTVCPCFVFQTRSIEMEWLGIQGFTVCCGGWHCWFYRKSVCNLILGVNSCLLMEKACLCVCVEINLTCELFSCLLLGMPLVNSLFLISPSGFWIDLMLF